MRHATVVPAISVSKQLLLYVSWCLDCLILLLIAVSLSCGQTVKRLRAPQWLLHVFSEPDQSLLGSLNKNPAFFAKINQGNSLSPFPKGEADINLKTAIDLKKGKKNKKKVSMISLHLRWLWFNVPLAASFANNYNKSIFIVTSDGTYRNPHVSWGVSILFWAQ